MSHNYDVTGTGNYQIRILRTKFSKTEYFSLDFLRFAYSGGILNGKRVDFEREVQDFFEIRTLIEPDSE